MEKGKGLSEPGLGEIQGLGGKDVWLSGQV
jgi:hypothetical protein